MNEDTVPTRYKSTYALNYIGSDSEVSIVNHKCNLT